MNTIILLAALSFSGVDPDGLRPLFDAIRQVESGGRDNAVGDGGKSVGPYQIGRAYWADGCKQGNVKWDYDEHVRDSDHCEYVMYYYWQRYCRQAMNGDWQTLARVHNGGPTGPAKKATLPYWQKVKKELEHAR